MVMDLYKNETIVNAAHQPFDILIGNIPIIARRSGARILHGVGGISTDRVGNVTRSVVIEAVKSEHFM